MRKIKSLVRLILGLFLSKTKWWLERENGHLCFSQEGEDIVLFRLFEGKRNGRFVDIGAHHPIRFSNTYMFYRAGWRGVNIDPLPGMKNLFERHRPGDVSIEAAVWHKEEEVLYHMFNEPAFNNIGEKAASPTSKLYWHIETRKITAKPLTKLLEQVGFNCSDIDFLTIDVEGAEISILQTIDWNRFKPQYIVVEAVATDARGQESELVQFMKTASYKPLLVLPHSVVFSRSATN